MHTIRKKSFHSMECMLLVVLMSCCSCSSSTVIAEVLSTEEPGFETEVQPYGGMTKPVRLLRTERDDFMPGSIAAHDGIEHDTLEGASMLEMSRMPDQAIDEKPRRRGSAANEQGSPEAANDPTTTTEATTKAAKDPTTTTEVTTKAASTTVDATTKAAKDPTTTTEATTKVAKDPTTTTEVTTKAASTTADVTTKAAKESTTTTEVTTKAAKDPTTTTELTTKAAKDPTTTTEVTTKVAKDPTTTTEVTTKAASTTADATTKAAETTTAPGETTTTEAGATSTEAPSTTSKTTKVSTSTTTAKATTKAATTTTEETTEAPSTTTTTTTAVPTSTALTVKKDIIGDFEKHEKEVQAKQEADLLTTSTTTLTTKAATTTTLTTKAAKNTTTTKAVVAATTAKAVGNSTTLDPTAPVNCVWADWEKWGECSFSCGGGTMERSRKVAQEALRGGDCDGDEIEVSKCNNQSCPVDCVLGEWETSNCSKACGGGTRIKHRAVKTKAANGGKECDMSNLSWEETCNTSPCVRDCKLADWSRWGECSKTCTGGQQSRTREIVTEKEGAGKDCDPLDMDETVACNDNITCPLDCAWEDWSDWSACSDSCGRGNRTRTRDKKQDAKGGGTSCTGEPQDTLPCLPVDSTECPPATVTTTSEEATLPPILFPDATTSGPAGGTDNLSKAPGSNISTTKNAKFDIDPNRVSDFMPDDSVTAPERTTHTFSTSTTTTTTVTTSTTTNTTNATLGVPVFWSGEVTNCSAFQRQSSAQSVAPAYAYTLNSNSGETVQTCCRKCILDTNCSGFEFLHASVCLLQAASVYDESSKSSTGTWYGKLPIGRWPAQIALALRTTETTTMTTTTTTTTTTATTTTTTTTITMSTTTVTTTTNTTTTTTEAHDDVVIPSPRTEPADLDSEVSADLTLEGDYGQVVAFNKIQFIVECSKEVDPATCVNVNAGTGSIIVTVAGASPDVVRAAASNVASGGLELPTFGVIRQAADADNMLVVEPRSRMKKRAASPPPSALPTPAPTAAPSPAPSPAVIPGPSAAQSAASTVAASPSSAPSAASTSAASPSSSLPAPASSPSATLVPSPSATPTPPSPVEAVGSGPPPPAGQTETLLASELKYCDSAGCQSSDVEGKECKRNNQEAKQIPCEVVMVLRSTAEIKPHWGSKPSAIQKLAATEASREAVSIDASADLSDSLSGVTDAVTNGAEGAQDSTIETELRYCDSEGCQSSDPNGADCKAQNPLSQKVPCPEGRFDTGADQKSGAASSTLAVLAATAAASLPVLAL